MREDAYKLSICLATMNRAGQLKEALQSCLACALPERTEFVIIDNASVDETETVVRETLGASGFPYVYEKLPENIGAGAGRCRYYEKARGAYIFGFDDDAVIDAGNCSDFFVRAVHLLDRHPEISVLATQVYDTAWQADRQAPCGRPLADALYRCYMFCGGSHFLRKAFFGEAAPYFANRYGYEELPPSLLAADRGRGCFFCPSLRVIHKPKIDKWDKHAQCNLPYLIAECATPYAIKRMLYPRAAQPLLAACYSLRKRRHLPDAESRKRADALVRETMEAHRLKGRIRFSTFCFLACCFGAKAL